jgi:dTDP-4-amino-4,6-dideoxygalactose transaminase
MSVIERQQFILGEEVAALERAVAGLSQAGHAIACASGTDALLLSLKTLDLKPGDEVIAPAFTFFATAGTIHNAGGRPVFADIDAATFNVDPAAVEAAITPRTRHQWHSRAARGAGAILEIARPADAVIEDAARAVGPPPDRRGVVHRRRARLVRHAVVLSSKNLAAGAAAA